MDRKKFLLTSSLAAFSLTTCGSVVKAENDRFIGDCDTTNDILGPFYRKNAPLRTDLTTQGLKGNRILIQGRVFEQDCETVIPDVLVEIWQCNTEGEYDNDSPEFRQRGSWKTNAKGEYSFLTILPGKYLNGALYRPSHVHFRVTSKNHEEIISQIYFKGDPHITEDPWASQKKAEHRILELSPMDTKGSLQVNFNLYLKSKI